VAKVDWHAGRNDREVRAIRRDEADLASTLSI
jgi:hypothetical protein